MSLAVWAEHIRTKWLYLALAAVTFFTTTMYGAAAARCFNSGHSITLEAIWDSYALLLAGNLNIESGLLFSIPLFLILGAHEFGHYAACRRSYTDATLPYFLPSPFLLGTFGAFIRVRGPIYQRKVLFDIGVSGPIAGFLVLIPVLIAGIALSKPLPAAPDGSDILFGSPLLMRIAEQVRFPGIHPDQLLLHPTAQAAWGGLLATAINLLPVGQLDGGHIVYSLFGSAHRKLSLTFLFLLLAMGYFSLSWVAWAVALFFLGVRHPLVYDDAPLDRQRKLVAAFALAILVLSFSLTPLRVG